MADGSVKIEVILDDTKVGGGVKKVEGRLSGIGNAAKIGLATVGKLAGALGLVGLAYKGIDMVKNSLDGAIDRYDTLNNFPRVMQQMGFDADESQQAINKLSDGVQGLPTRLDEVASTAQNIAVMTGDLDGAVDTTLALNNAFLASGASTQDAERGLQQYVQMLAKGEVDLTSWRTLQETMPYALRETAKAFGFTGKSATNDFYDALKNGDITMSEFNDKLIELDTAQGGFAETAREASGGLRTAWTNMSTWIVTGVADIIGAIDKAMGGTGEIENAINNLKPAIQGVFGWIADVAIPKVAEAIKTLIDVFGDIVEKAKEVYGALQPWLPVIAAIAAGVGTFMLVANAATIVGLAIAKAAAIFNTLRTAIMIARGAMIALNAAMLANPIALIVAAIVAAAVLIYVYWEPIKEFFLNLWESIKEAGLLIWENLKEGWRNAKENLTQAWESVKEFFSSLWEGIKEIFTSTWEFLSGTWDSAVEGLKTAWEAVTEFFSGLWEGIKGIFTSSWDSISESWTGAIESLKEMWSTITEFFSGLWDSTVEIFSNAYNGINEMTGGIFGEYVEIIQSYLMTAWEIITSIWDFIKETFNNALQLIKSLVTGDFEGMKEVMQNQMDNAKNLLSNIWNAIKTNIGAKLIEILSNVKDKFNEIKSNITNKITEAKNNLVKRFTDMVSNARNKATEIVTNVRNKFNEVKQNISNKINEAKTALVNKFTEMVTNATNKASEIVTAVKNKFEEVKNGIRDKLTEAVQTVSEKVGEMPGKVVEKASDMVSAGKDLILGLIDGIKSMAQGAIDAITGVVDGVVNKAKSMLQIKSPSRVMMKIGKHTSGGMAKGITKGKKGVTKASKDLANEAIKNLDVKFDTKKIGAKRYISDLKKIRKQYKLTADQRRKVEKNIYKANQALKKQSQTQKKQTTKRADSRIKNLQVRFDTEKLSPKGYINALKSVRKSYKLTGDQSRKVQKEIYKANQAIKKQAQLHKKTLKKVNDGVKSTDLQYLKKVRSINNKLAKDIKKVQNDYKKRLADLTKSIYNQHNLFDEVKTEKVDGKQLIKNLYDQNKQFKQFNKDISKLQKAGVSKKFITELREIGLSAADEIHAIANLPKKELNTYVNAWKEKHKLAEAEAKKQMAKEKANMQKEIRALTKAANKELAQANRDWKARLRKLSSETAKLGNFKNSGKVLGKDTARGLINGLRSMNGPLQKQARATAKTVEREIKKALKIKSPSQLMRDEVGAMIPAGIAQGIDDGTKSAIDAMDRLSDSLSSDIDANINLLGDLKGLTANSVIGNIPAVSHHVIQEIKQKQTRANKYDDSKVIELLEQLVDKDGNVYLNKTKVGSIMDKEQAKRIKMLEGWVAID